MTMRTTAMTRNDPKTKGKPLAGFPRGVWGSTKMGQKSSPMTEALASLPPSAAKLGGEAGLPWERKIDVFAYENVVDEGGREEGREGMGKGAPAHPLPPSRGVSERHPGWGSEGGHPKTTAGEDFEIELPWPNRSGNRSVRHGGGSHYLSQDAVAYRQVARRLLAARRLADRGWGGPYLLRWTLSPPTARCRDFDNLMKVVADALTWSGLIVDDSNQVIAAGSWEWTAPENPGRILIVGRRI